MSGRLGNGIRWMLNRWSLVSFVRAGLVGALVGALVGCSESSAPAQTESGQGAERAAAKSEARASSQGGKGPRPALVELGEVRGGSLHDGWTFLGRVEAAHASELAAAVSGHVRTVEVREGDHVAANKTVVTLDSAKILAELAASRAREGGLSAELEHARKQYERVSGLQYPAVSQPELDRFRLDIAKLEAQTATQKAETRRLQVELDRHSLEAPFAGVVAARHVDPGAWVNPGTPVLSLVSLEELEVHVDVSAELGGRIRVGDRVTVRSAGGVGVGAGKAQEVAAEILGIVGVLDQSTRTMRVRLGPEERPSWMLVGLAVDVEFPVELGGAMLSAEASDLEGGVLVSRDALVRGPVRTRVIKYDDGKAVPIYVEVLATAKDMALVVSAPDEPALRAGDRVVIRGNDRLRPGQPIQVKERSGGAGAGAGSQAQSQE